MDERNSDTCALFYVIISKTLGDNVLCVTWVYVFLSIILRRVQYLTIYCRDALKTLMSQNLHYFCQMFSEIYNLPKGVEFTQQKMHFY